MKMEMEFEMWLMKEYVVNVDVSEFFEYLYKYMREIITCVNVLNIDTVILLMCVEKL